MITTGKFHCTSDQSFEEEEERRNLLEFSFSPTQTQSELQYERIIAGYYRAPNRSII